MNKGKRHYVRWVVLALTCVLLTTWLFRINVLFTSNHLSLTYARSATSMPLWYDQMFYVKDNVLYFIDDNGKKDRLCYVENNIIKTFVKLPYSFDHFVVADDETVIIQRKDILYSLNVSDGVITELWQGACVGYYEDQLYFTNDSALYAAKIGQGEPQKVLSFDELLASYHDGIIYRNGEEICQLLLEQTDAPQVLTKGNIPWPDAMLHWLLDEVFLYTSDYALHIGSHTIDMYTYKTGAMKRIYEAADAHDGSMVTMAVTARENEIYISRLLTHISFWKIRDKNINGTYRYDIQADTWTKITDATYSTIAQFDDRYLYGNDSGSFFDYGVLKITKN